MDWQTLNQIAKSYKQFHERREKNWISIQREPSRLSHMRISIICSPFGLQMQVPLLSWYSRYCLLSISPSWLTCLDKASQTLFRNADMNLNKQKIHSRPKFLIYIAWCNTFTVWEMTSLHSHLKDFTFDSTFSVNDE